MASIIARTRADGTKSYRADIRIKRKGRLVYQESRTFDRKALAKDWAARRELELQEPGMLEKVKHRGVSVGELIQRYIKEYGANFGRTKHAHLEYMRSFDLADRDALELQPSDIVSHVMWRLQTVKPQTANNDIIWLRSVFKVARTAWGMPVNLSVIDDAAETCKRERLVGKADSRDRRPTLEELNKLMEYAGRESAQRQIPMGEIILFALFSGRRQEEITRIRWDGLDEKNRTVMVTDMKHPTAKRGNHKRVHLTEEAWAIIQRQPERGDRIFPDNSRSIGTRFREWCLFLGIDDLRFHDLRHECISWLFERGWDIPRVAAVSGHNTWSSLQKYTHLSRQEPHDKYEGWSFRPATM
ncbi:tyrosine-type recombinase/integrase [Marinobacter oulmenensis]|uniref:Integrase n=1 Tax=Marinobacter oulmenensis TaxID=643747 RepID=A0A840UEQ8_9GAMM|nr:integrase [Marinobacter oulmenensis]